MRDLVLFAIGIFAFMALIEVGPKAVKLADLWMDDQIAVHEHPEPNRK